MKGRTLAAGFGATVAAVVAVVVIVVVVLSKSDKDSNRNTSTPSAVECCTLTLTECTSESLCNDNAQACEAMCGGLWANETDLEATATYCCSANQETCLGNEECHTDLVACATCGGSFLNLLTEVPTSPPTTIDTDLTCPPVNEVQRLGGVLAGQSVSFTRSSATNICMLWRVTTEGRSRQPVARSYEGHAWEASAVPAFGYLTFACDDNADQVCTTTLPTLEHATDYYEMATLTHELPPRDQVARFLEQTTFGPTWENLVDFDSTATSFATWMQEQQESVPASSHRSFYRQRVNHRAVVTSPMGILTHPCRAGTRYRRYAFSDKDRLRALEIRTVDDRKLLLVDGQARTMLVTETIYAGQPRLGIEFTDGFYRLCAGGNEVGGQLSAFHPEVNGCRTLVTESGSRGNPPVTFDDLTPPTNPSVDLNGHAVEVDAQYFADGVSQELFLVSDLDEEVCQSFPAVTGVPQEFVVVGLFQGDLWIHDSRFLLQENDLEHPLHDGGGTLMESTRNASPVYRVQCSNVPRTFLNEDFCFLTDAPTFCAPGEDTDSTVRVSLTLDPETFHRLYQVTNQEAYFYAVTGLRQEAGNTPYDPPCTASAISRWAPVDDCVSGLAGDATNLVFAELLRQADDSNPNLRDVIFPAVDIACSDADAETYNFKVLVDGQCWQNVHESHLQVYDFSAWVTNHPGGPAAIQQFAGPSGNYTIAFPAWHDMSRWYGDSSNFRNNAGRLGDRLVVQIPLQLAQALNLTIVSNPEAPKSMLVCGSPDEVANDPELLGSFNRGAFDAATLFNRTTGTNALRRQKLAVWMEIALQGEDQLRQRVAFALSQILVITPSAIQQDHLTELFVSYYDIFVRNAFGNYRDILQEVSYSPLMGEMLSYRDSRSTAFVWQSSSRIEYADENYAREVMQLFSVGLYMLHNNGTRVLEESGNFVQTYTNDDISEYARLWTGFQRQPSRGNIEDPTPQPNRQDPMRVTLRLRDNLPKMGLGNWYIGDGLPLCSDLPDRHFLRAGASYRLLGSSAVADLLSEDSDWVSSDSVVRLRLDESSALFAMLCNSLDGSTADCRFKGRPVVGETMACTGRECDIESPRVVEVNGAFFEYLRPSCAYTAFYDAAKTMRTRVGSFFCGDPNAVVGGTNCCGGEQDEWSVHDFEIYTGERNSYDSSAAKCVDRGASICTLQRPECTDCDNDIGYWTALDCRLQVKIDLGGNVAIVHGMTDARIQLANVHRAVREDTKTYFQVDWEGPIEESLASYQEMCSDLGCTRDSYDNLCLCPVSVVETQAFTEIPTREDVLAELYVGTFSPAADDLSNSDRSEVAVYDQSGALTMDSVFEVTDDNGQVQLRKNVVSKVVVGSTSQRRLSFRNPPHVILFTSPELRDTHYETDAAIDHYFFHPNVAPFLTVRFAQRFGISNPSPRYVDVVATAFRTGFYRDESAGVEFGSKEYGDMSAFIAALLLDREARSIVLDADPSHGSAIEPFLKILRVLRSLAFQPDVDKPFVEFGSNLQDIVGQQPYEMPSVFSFFLPEHQPAGVVGEAALVCPECQVLTGPKGVNLVNGIISLLKYGLDSAFGGFGVGRNDNQERILGQSTLATGRLSFSSEGFPTARDVVDGLASLLTSGRLSSEKRDLMVSLYEQYRNLRGETEALINVEQLIALTPEFHTRGIMGDGQGLQDLPSEVEPSQSPYRAIVNVFLEGGYDSYNLLVPLECDGTNQAGIPVHLQYLSERGELSFSEVERSLTIEVDSDSGQPCSTFAVHDEMTLLKELYDDGDLIFVANMGVIDNAGGLTKLNFQDLTDVQLFAHNTMQQETKTVDPKAVHTGTGVLGRVAEVLTESGFKTNSISIDDPSIIVTARSNEAPAPLVVSRSGVSTFSPQPEGEILDATAYAFELNPKTGDYSSLFGQTWSDRFTKGIYEAETLKESLEATSLGAHWSTENVPELGEQFGTVARLIQARDSRGTDRDFMNVQFGSWDHHRDMKLNLRSKFSELNEGLSWLVQELKEEGVWDNVAIVITSDFARTITPNSGGGSDHAWGGHYFIMGGAVKGGKMLGKYPADLTASGPLNLGRGRLIPQTSWDCLWNGVSQWMGVITEPGLDRVLPNRHVAEGTADDDFTQLFSESDLFTTPT